MQSMSKKALELWQRSATELKLFMSYGTQPDKESLAGFEYLGLNVGPLPKMFGFQKFIKFFHMPVKWMQSVVGNNIRVSQNGFAAIYIKLMKNTKPVEQGYFVVGSARDNPKWNHYSNASFLDYGKGDNSWKEPARFLRDYLVQPFPGNTDILLGHAFIYIWPFKISVGFFVLEKVMK